MITSLGIPLVSSSLFEFHAKREREEANERRTGKQHKDATQWISREKSEANQESSEEAKAESSRFTLDHAESWPKLPGQNCRVIGQNPPPNDNYELEASKHSPAARITRILRQHSEALVMAQLVKHRDCDSPSPLSFSFIACRLHKNHTSACKGPSGCE